MKVAEQGGGWGFGKATSLHIRAANSGGERKATTVEEEEEEEEGCQATCCNINGVKTENLVSGPDASGPI